MVSFAILLKSFPVSKLKQLLLTSGSVNIVNNIKYCLLLLVVKEGWDWLNIFLALKERELN